MTECLWILWSGELHQLNLCDLFWFILVCSGLFSLSVRPRGASSNCSILVKFSRVCRLLSRVTVFPIENLSEKFARMFSRKLFDLFMLMWFSLISLTHAVSGLPTNYLFMCLSREMETQTGRSKWSPLCVHKTKSETYLWTTTGID